MTLYFATQQTNLTVPFPVSIIAVTDSAFYRRYAVSSVGAIDKDDDEGIDADIQTIKVSPHIVVPKEGKTEKRVEKKK